MHRNSDFIDHINTSTRKKLQMDVKVMHDFLFVKYGNESGHNIQRAIGTHVVKSFKESTFSEHLLKDVLVRLRFFMDSPVWIELCERFGVDHNDGKLAADVAKGIFYFCVDAPQMPSSSEELLVPAETAVRQHVAFVNKERMFAFVDEIDGRSLFNETVEQFCQERGLSAKDSGAVAFIAHGALKLHIEHVTDRLLSHEDMARLILTGKLPGLAGFSLKSAVKTEE